MGRVARGLGVVGLVLALAGCWPMPGQNSDRTGYNAVESEISRANVSQLVQKWSVSAGAPVSAPAVSSAGVHVTGGAALSTYRASDGALLWRVVVPPEPGTVDEIGAPFVVDDRVLTGWHSAINLGTFPNDAGTSSFDVATGAGTTVGTGPGWGPVVAVRGHTIVTSALWRQGIFQWVSSGVVDLDDPTTRWTSSTLSGPGLSGEVTLGEQRLYDAARPPAAYPLSGGAPLWTASGPTPSASPVIGPGEATIYVDTFQGVGALDATTGAVLWTASVGAGVSQPSLANGLLFVPTDDGRIVTFDAGGCGSSTCSALWEASTGTGSAIRSQPAIAGGVLFAGASDGVLYAFDAAGCGAATCDALWSAPTGSLITGSPAVSNGRLYVGTANGLLISYGLPS